MANQMLAKGDEKPRLTIKQMIRSQLFNPEFSDVCFLVGDQREKIYAHRLFLVTESDVFKAMFYGELKETRYEIEVPDLSPVGFRNMIKYFYTKKVEIDLSEMHQTYMAANKYLASGLIKDLTVQITESCLDISNACVIYDQLLKLAIDDSLVRDIKIKIATRFSETCASDSFKQIGEDTLVAILKFNMLNISEFELLKVCLRWTDGEVTRRESEKDRTGKRAAFEPVKHLIRFGDLSPSDFGSISEIENYLTVEEIGSILLHLFHSCKPIQIDYRSQRKPYEAQFARAIKSVVPVKSLNSRILNLGTLISVDKAVRISSVETFGISSCEDLTFEIRRDGKSFPSAFRISGGQGGYTIELNLILQPNTDYDLRFSFSLYYDHDPNDTDEWESYYYPSSLGISREMTLKSDESSVVFKFKSDLGYHCVESIGFFGPFD